jgi:hypothetical protein
MIVEEQDGSRRRGAAGLGTKAKVLLTAGVMGTTALAAGAATFGTWTTTTTANMTVGSGTVALTYQAGSYTNTLTTAASGLVPGDIVKRAFQINNTSTDTLASVTMAASGSGSLLGVGGLTAQLDECSSGWVEVGHVYTCTGTTTAMLASTALSTLTGAASTLSNASGTVDQAGVHSMLLTLSLPSAAANALQGQSSTITWTFTGTQRAADSLH